MEVIRLSPLIKLMRPLERPMEGKNILGEENKILVSRKIFLAMDIHRILLLHT